MRWLRVWTSLTAPTLQQVGEEGGGEEGGRSMMSTFHTFHTLNTVTSGGYALSSPIIWLDTHFKLFTPPPPHTHTVTSGGYALSFPIRMPPLPAATSSGSGVDGSAIPAAGAGGGGGASSIEPEATKVNLWSTSYR